MRGAAMSLTAAASGLVVFLLSVSVVQGLDGWGVTYSSTEICSVKGSSVEIRCSYTYPSTWKGSVNTVQRTFWLTQKKDGEYVEVTTDSEYAGRVKDLFENNTCTLRIRNLTESDSAEYRFRFTTSKDAFWGIPVTLSVTDLQVQDHFLSSAPSSPQTLERSQKLLSFVTIPVVLLAVIALSVFLWIRRKKASRDSSEPEERADNRRERHVMNQGYVSIISTAAVALTFSVLAGAAGDLQYASVHFSNNRADPLYSNMRAARPLGHTEQQEVPEYAAVKFSSAAPRSRGQDPEEDPAALYSTVNKSR
ncbi:hypothetical protein KUCAC02_031752 [Chaenocephalus aceratus]|nr:hypothetical protein KUCAC02_031752 [Chaenocephalus aceratus]